MTPRAPDDPESELLARYFAGECSPAEIALLQTWMTGQPARQLLVDQLRRGWEAAGSVVLRGDVERGWAELSARMDEPRVAATPTRASVVLRLQPATQPRGWWEVARRAAAFIVVIGVGVIASWQVGWRDDSDKRVAAGTPPLREVTTRRGEQANVYLSDGTRVVLGVASSLRFPTAFGDVREVELDGEAFFEIAHDSLRSFVVRMPFGAARDIGTKFAVRAYRDLGAATVTVTEGSVVLTPTDRPTDADSLIIGVMGVGSVSADGRLRALPGAAAAHLAWMSGRLVFDQMPLPEAVAQINRWYDIDLRVGDPALADLRLSASLTNEPVDKALEVVARALDARIVRRDSTLTLYRSRTER